MNITEVILIAAALQLVTMGCALIAIGEAWKRASVNFRMWQAALYAYSEEKAAHNATKRDLLEERLEHGTEARNVDARTI